MLAVQPERIHAADRDSLETPLEYSFKGGRPGTYSAFFSINPRTGAVTQIAPVDRDVVQQFEITVQVGVGCEVFINGSFLFPCYLSACIKRASTIEKLRNRTAYLQGNLHI